MYHLPEPKEGEFFFRVPVQSRCLARWASNSALRQWITRNVGKNCLADVLARPIGSCGFGWGFDAGLEVGFVDVPCEDRNLIMRVRAVTQQGVASGSKAAGAVESLAIIDNMVTDQTNGNLALQHLLPFAVGSYYAGHVWYQTHQRCCFSKQEQHRTTIHLATRSYLEARSQRRKRFISHRYVPGLNDYVDLSKEIQELEARCTEGGQDPRPETARPASVSTDSTGGTAATGNEGTSLETVEAFLARAAPAAAPAATTQVAATAAQAVSLQPVNRSGILPGVASALSMPILGSSSVTAAGGAGGATVGGGTGDSSSGGTPANPPTGSIGELRPTAPMARAKDGKLRARGAVRPTAKDVCSVIGFEFFENSLEDRAASSPQLFETADSNGCVGLVAGHNVYYGLNADGTTGKIGGVRCVCIPNMAATIFTNTAGNAAEAYKKRVVEKRVEPTLTEEDKWHIQDAVKYLTEKVFTKDAIGKFLSYGGDMHYTKNRRYTAEEYKSRIDEMLAEASAAMAQQEAHAFDGKALPESHKSRKWTSRRFENAMIDLLTTMDDKMRHTIGIKREVGKDGKPPRLLLSDGDRGQMMALLLIAVLEGVLFEHFKDHCIKHKGRSEGINDIIKSLMRMGNSQPTMVAEGDGSNWDTCCSALIRSLIEAPVLKKIGQILVDLGFAPKSWIDTYSRAADAKDMKVQIKRTEMRRKLYDVIASYRRSGERGTSVLNYMINIVLWAAALGAQPQDFLDITTKKYVCKFTGRELIRYFACEGDDSILRLHTVLALYERDILAFWTRCGFLMKLVLTGKDKPGVAEFCGVHIEVAHKSGATGRWQPDLKRALRNSAWSVSGDAIAAVELGEKGTRIIRKIAYQTFLARAESFAKKNDVAAAYFMALARGAKPDSTPDAMDREAAMRSNAGDRWLMDGVTDADYEEHVRGQIRYGQPKCPAVFLEHQGMEWPRVRQQFMGVEAEIKWQEDATPYLPIGLKPSA